MATIREQLERLGQVPVQSFDDWLGELKQSGLKAGVERDYFDDAAAWRGYYDDAYAPADALAEDLSYADD